MNKYQTARLDSLNLIVKESNNNPASIALVPNFGIAINRMETICNELGELHVSQEKDLTGITADKEVDFENLIDTTVDISGAVYSYAHDMKDNTLMAKVNLKTKAIERMTQSEVVAVAGITLEEALKVPAEDLANEGISATEMSDYQELISHFSSIKSSKREAVIDRSGTTEKISKLFKEASSLLNNKLDRLATQFKRKDPEFYLKYKAARSVQYRANRKKVAEEDLTVTD
ncbi:MAG: hypothetical protein K0M40_05620 [Prolixibacteraceae bacterium]|nr:hypothetical protein [Prolixibacteraceae bacterium]